MKIDSGFFARGALVVATAALACSLAGCIADASEDDLDDETVDVIEESLKTVKGDATRSKLVDGKYTLTAHSPRDGYSDSNPNFGPFANAAVTCPTSGDCDGVRVKTCLRRRSAGHWGSYVCDANDTEDGAHRRWGGVWSNSHKEGVYQSLAILTTAGGAKIARIHSFPRILKTPKK